MADEQALLSAPTDDFFTRCGLDQRARLDCHDFAQKIFPDRAITPAPTQGYCSYTISIDDYIVQFRPPKYKLDLAVVSAAKTIFGSYAPTTTYNGTVSPHGLHVYTMRRIPGISYKELLTLSTPPHTTAQIRKTLCEDLAAFLARAWHHHRRHHHHAAITLSPGTIASSIPARLHRLQQSLPPRFQPSVRHILTHYDLIRALPTVLTHGDIVPSNILLDPRDGHLCGLVDWAEAEMLPFGICLYGLEDILGRYIAVENHFVYYADAETARDAFWVRFRAEVPVGMLLGGEGGCGGDDGGGRGEGEGECGGRGEESSESQGEKALKLARDLGVLLWHGFAFDDGAINRVVEEGRDVREICYLDALLLGHGRRHDSLL